MAARFFTRSLITAKHTISSAVSRSYTSLSLSTLPTSVSSASILRLRPLVAVSAHFHRLSPGTATIRGYATRQSSSSLNDPNPNWSNRPPKETILLDGCDFEHWLIVMEKPEGDPTRDEIIDSYIKTLATVVGSEEEARMKIYSVSTRHYFAFGALVSEELSYKIKELPKVRWVLPDSYLDVKNKDYGGEPFINGQAVPYDPKYHEEWVRNNARANERNRRNDRPRNFDRSRNFERRRENVQNRDFQMANQGMQNPGSNMGGAPPGNMGGMQPNNMGQMPPPPNMGGMRPNNMGGGPPPNMGGAPNMGGMRPNNMGGGLPNMGGMPPSNMGGGAPNMGGMPPNNMGGMPGNMGGMPPNNMGGMPPNNLGGMPGNAPNFRYGDGPNNGGMPQHREMPRPGQNMGYQPSYAPNSSGGNPHQTQDMPIPPPPKYQ
ncbi:multiple organellar RNA editing factor 8, chloroplastic/mitochondrial isoform X2 [Diospyros lotus]|uniref:multiple organellar RNA editing factor 8, chloroplastic/mitochondrial isoform X2 n=1 Tax=Diospyros lotus TaxID=55363 RepID=UPI00225BC5C9|nr:multiple organellar RNA editing factor 8, chloroplastic/mitochondrial isoform X2 [Diospyros lotus]